MFIASNAGDQTPAESGLGDMHTVPQSTRMGLVIFFHTVKRNSLFFRFAFTFPMCFGELACSSSVTLVRVFRDLEDAMQFASS